MKRNLFILFFIYTLSVSFANPYKVNNGICLLESPDILEKKVVELKGTWELYINKHIETAYINDSTSDYWKRLLPDTYISVPNYWKNYLPEVNGKKTSFGYGSYRILISGLKPNFNYALMMRESPGTSSKWIINQKTVFTSGKVSSDYLKSIPQAIPCYASFVSDGNGVAELVIQVSNGVHRKGGLWDSILISEETTLFKFYSTQASILFAIFGVLISLTLFSIISFFINTKKKDKLFLGIFTLALAIRILIANFSIMTLTFPHIPYGLQLKLEYLSLWVCPSAFLMLLKSIFARPLPLKILSIITITFQLILGTLSIILPIKLANCLIPFMQLSALMVLVYVIYICIYMVVKKEKDSLAVLLSMVITGTGLVLDIFFASKKGVLPFSMLPFFSLFFCLFQFFILSRKQSLMIKEIIQLGSELKELNKSYLRFVPKEFLQILNKDSVIDVQPGDFVETEMTILYTNIHLIPHNKEEEVFLSPENNYKIFSEFFKEIAHLTKKHNGFISKFISSGVIALFPKNTEDALFFATDLQEKLVTYNNLKIFEGLEFFVSIGIHYGKMILGTIGEPSRLDDTVISDTVNTVSRIENYAFNKKESTVLSLAASNKISKETKDKYYVKSLGDIRVKGKSQSLKLTSWKALILCLLVGMLPLKAQSFTVAAPETLSDFGTNIIGPWEFYWGKFIDPTVKDLGYEPDCLINVPVFWNDFPLPPEAKKIAKHGKGSGSYRIHVNNLKPNTEYSIFLFDLASTAFTLYANGQKIESVGVPAEDWTKSQPQKSMKIASFYSDNTGSLDLVFHVSNNFYRTGGIWKEVILKETPLQENFFFSNLYKSFLFIGALLMIFVYQFSLFMFKKDDKSSLYLAFFALAMLLRIISSGFSPLLYYFPNIPISYIIWMEHECLYLGPLFFILYLCKVYPDLFRNKLKFVPHVLIYIGIFFTLSCLFLSPRLRTFMVRPWQIYLVISGIIMITKLIQRTIARKTLDFLLMAIGLFIILFCVFHDILYIEGKNLFIKTDMIPYGFLIFVVIQCAIIARQHDQQEIAINEYTQNLQDTINACYRFVPNEILVFFDKDDITSLELGEHTTRSMTIMNTDIRNFTTISETISPKETFDLLNRYLMDIAPIIRSHGGFIEKYLGDGIIALFPQNGEQALACAMEMHMEMEILRKALVKEGKPELKIGIGLHYGTIVLGTVGDNDRMNEISVSPDINTVLMLETLTKTYNKPIIVSESAKNNWNTENLCYNYTELDVTKLPEDINLKEKLYTIEQIKY